MREPRNLIERIEWAHRRLERAKLIIENGLIEQAQTTKGPIYLCKSQTHQDKLYVIEADNCPCRDEYQAGGHKICKHILARLIIEEGIPLAKIGADPIYWKGEEVSTNGKQALATA